MTKGRGRTGGDCEAAIAVPWRPPLAALSRHSVDAARVNTLTDAWAAPGGRAGSRGDTHHALEARQPRVVIILQLVPLVETPAAGLLSRPQLWPFCTCASRLAAANVLREEEQRLVY